jgi:nitrite reductase/ring-hydroxylating ferredoxin subunit
MSEKQYTIKDASKLENGKSQVIDLDGTRIILARLDDVYYAFNDQCTHENVSLSEGSIDNLEIECPQHGARFDIKTGEVRALPAVRPLQTYKVSNDNGNLIINIPSDENK